MWIRPTEVDTSSTEVDTSSTSSDTDITAQAVEGDCNGDGRVDLTDALLGCLNSPSVTIPDNFDRPPGTPEGDRAVLEALFLATDGNNWWKRDGWLSNEPLSAWEGVSTNENGRVDYLFPA